MFEAVRIIYLISYLITNRGFSLLSGNRRVKELISLVLHLLLELTLNLIANLLHHHILCVNLVHLRWHGLDITWLRLLINLLLRWRHTLLNLLRIHHHLLRGHHLRLVHSLTRVLKYTPVIRIGKIS